MRSVRAIAELWMELLGVFMTAALLAVAVVWPMPVSALLGLSDWVGFVGVLVMVFVVSTWYVNR